ncbi:hypothetical protein BK120_04005 [Paenibacillus sp. FSL A5-0031]|uniref:hypothetical protein n=1 Tax=Paenibacillus sp. FSL A5-0031 TaxID=1920420 RepID=UPI00096D5704|nr:hypothetical protein [Paenibacillus sp. FSL A5-0031]OME87155.1 hypothetical protein BK120_04005 [Paenibacillus sp. FSL A5-0031]
MKKKVIRGLVAVVLVGAGVWVGVNFASPLEAESNALTPGSVEDPVVTKSYVDEQLAKLGGGTPGGGTTTPVADTALEVVTVPAGKTLMAGQGTEVIVRVGKAIAYSSDASGIADLTGGTDLTKGKAVPTNHLLLFPREGRGILPDPNQKNGLTVLVKGKYSLQ